MPELKIITHARTKNTNVIKNVTQKEIKLYLNKKQN